MLALEKASKWNRRVGKTYHPGQATILHETASRTDNSERDGVERPWEDTSVQRRQLYRNAGKAIFDGLARVKKSYR